MEMFDVLLQAGLITCGLVLYLLFRRSVPKLGNYNQAGWNYAFKYLFARFAVKSWKSKLKATPVLEEPRPDQLEGWDAATVRTTAPDGSAVFLSIRKICARQPLAETIVHVKLSDGTTYVMPQSPEASAGAWESTPGGWSSNGLKILILEPTQRWRIIYNGLLTRVHDNVTQHVKLNLIWTSASKAIRYPEDWSSQLAAQSLAVEPWRDSKWSRMLGKYKDGSWLQFGSMQGRFESFDEQGVIDQSVYLQTRGLRERSWAPAGYKELRRSVYLSAATSDGTVVQLRCLSYNNVLTHVISGSVRFPNFAVTSITGTDFLMSDFCESPEQTTNVYTINVSTSNRVLKLVARFNADNTKYTSGVPSQYEVILRTFVANIDGYSGAGICELGYETTVRKDPITITRAPLLKWLTAKQAGDVSYCVSLEERGAACPDYVGGKGASLALLASLARDEGYRVPPGFCLTIKALDKYLDQNPEIKSAIKDIEAANENYEESNFKAKCEKASSLFVATEITGDIKEDILSSMTYLRKKALEENLGPELRFAVRSSAVGEDSEVLSAAGQNETILGCETDDDIIKGVQKCWGSMFAFTSAYYRRQNGQPCLCGGGVVIQALAKARCAGVLFTRHPAQGDPRRILVTANYGLGESVVSGAVEPDTFIISRTTNPTTPLIISETVLGTKEQRVNLQGSSVSFEDVPESERSLACLTDEEVLRLATLGVVQDELWAAGRDIEWAFVGNEIFLLQARPITALERWSEEQLLHELDCPIMSDDELLTFGNAGEVMPRPMTALTYDMVIQPLTYGIDKIVSPTKDRTDFSSVTTHNRLALSLYNSVYRMVPKEIDINIRMVEMAIHGHAVADDHVLAVAHHRNPPLWYNSALGIFLMIKALINSKRSMKASIKIATSMSVKAEDEQDPQSILEATISALPEMCAVSSKHSFTTVASSSSQFIAMNVMLEGRKEFSPEVCNEIGVLLSSGDVLSAEVPSRLAKLARMLEASGHYDKFRALDPKDAMNWLKASLPQIYLEVCTFLEHHGYRAIMEFDLSTKPWVLRPEDMMKVLQNLRASAQETTKSKTDAEVIASLKSPQKSSTRKILRWVMPICRATVGHREGTKAHLILAVHKLRLAYIKLAKLMVKQWYLPHEDLIFHFRIQELKEYIVTRDAGLLRKAIQRQQYYPNWCKLKFAELNKGWLAPLVSQGPRVTSGDVKITAASVCGGEVVARACVVKDLSEIDQLQQGDILITHATDIGWSPYFPIIAGIVTELGGLISHGAVIAREYGLPCIVGAADATDIFRTGDLVRLSATHGTLERVLLDTDNTNKNTDT